MTGLAVATLIAAAGPATGQARAAMTPAADRAADAATRVRPALEAQLRSVGLDWGAPVLLRIFKQERELEAWVADDAGEFQLFKTWPICRWSGDLGPKLREGDGQAPEGFYVVRKSALNPRSTYHLSFDLGFPNAYDRAQSRTGSFLMVHGNCVSIGCYAMGDAGIDEIYTLVAAALADGRTSVPVHALPFRFTTGWDAKHRNSPWLAFWSNLAEGDALFRRTSRSLAVSVRDGRYAFTSP